MTADAVGGVWTYVRELTRSLADHDIQFIIALMGPASIQQYDSDAVGRLSNVQLVRRNYKLEWMTNPWQEVDDAGAWLLELADQHDVDLVHLNGYVHASLPWRVPCLVVAHSCVLTWWRAVHDESAPDEWNEYRRRVAGGLRSANHLVAPTYAFLKQLRREYPRLPNATVIYNARAATTFQRHNREQFVLAAGRLWDKAKNIATLDAAAEKIAWPVWVAGESTMLAERETLHHARGLGQLSEVALLGYMQRASVFASAALYEPFGLAILEAALNRCALVLSDIDSMRELWSGAAIFVEARDSAKWSAALNRLIADHELAESLGSAAFERAQLFAPKRKSQAYLDVYRSLLGASRERSYRCEAHA